MEITAVRRIRIELVATATVILLCISWLTARAEPKTAASPARPNPEEQLKTVVFEDDDQFELSIVNAKYHVAAQLKGAVTTGGGIVDRVSGDSVHLRSGEMITLIERTWILQLAPQENRYRGISRELLRPGLAVDYELQQGKLEKLVVIGIAAVLSGKSSERDRVQSSKLQPGKTGAESGDAVPLATQPNQVDSNRVVEAVQPRAWITEPVALLKQLKDRDAAFNNRSIEIEERSIDRIMPRSHLLDVQWQARRFGQQADKLPPDSEIPDDYDQLRRTRVLLTARGSETTVEILNELEHLKHPTFCALINRGCRWSTTGGVERCWSPETETLHTLGAPSRGSILESKRWRYEWTCGYGVASLMKSITSARVDRNRLQIEGTAQLIGYDQSTVLMELDHDLIIRNATITIPAQNGDGANDYVVRTRGTVRAENDLAMAATGSLQRFMKPRNKPARSDGRHDIAFVSVTAPLNDEQYVSRTRIEPPAKATTVDLKPKRKP
ncbi:MAG: hypothetical protein JWM11_6736 [Planctomycetaceae bacterium]|nr:hypothetical protein [Planctomycetaceae bacterium]